MTANPEQSAMEKVRQRWPDARLEEDFAESEEETMIYRIFRWDGFELVALSAWMPTSDKAWLDAASRLEAEHE